MTTDVVRQEGDVSYAQGAVDLAHVNRLSSKEYSVAQHEASAFLARVERYFDETYLHLDVKQLNERQRGVSKLCWKVLLVTNRGRYHTEQSGFGVEESLRHAFSALEEQVRSRLERLDSVY